MCLRAYERNALSDVVLELSRRRKNTSVRRSTLFFRKCFRQILAVVSVEKIIIERIGTLQETVNHGLRIGRWDHFGHSSMEFETSWQNLHWHHFHDYYVFQDNAQSQHEQVWK